MFQVEEGQTGSLGLYVAPRDGDPDSCRLSGWGGPRLVERVVSYSHGEWRLAHSVSVSSPGQYTLECSGSSDTEYVIADTDIAVEYDQAMLTGFGTLMLSVALGALLSVALPVAVAIRRGNHRQRLVREYQARAYHAWANGRPAARLTSPQETVRRSTEPERVLRASHRTPAGARRWTPPVPGTKVQP